MILQVPTLPSALVVFREGEERFVCAFVESGFEKRFFALLVQLLAAKVYTGMRLIGSPSLSSSWVEVFDFLIESM